VEGLGDYLSDMSSGSVSTDGVVKGWHELPITFDEAVANGRDATYDACVAAVREASEYQAPADHVTVIITHPSMFFFEYEYDGKFFASWNGTLGSFQHHSGTSLGLGRSFSNISDYCYFDQAERGAYGDL
jgi:hypothetical protein